MSEAYIYSVLEVSPTTYSEIRRLLEDAGYEDQFCTSEDGELIDMRGIAIKAGRVKCESCGTTVDGTLMECSYAEEMGGDKQCNCCEECRRECAMDI